jgi:hypothetical protein
VIEFANWRRIWQRKASDAKNHFHFMLKLGVNIDHVATLREARYRGRGFGEPSPVEAARMASPRICAKTGGTFKTAIFWNCAKKLRRG